MSNPKGHPPVPVPPKAPPPAAPAPSAANTRAVPDPVTGEIVASVTEAPTPDTRVWVSRQDKAGHWYLELVDAD